MVRASSKSGWKRHQIHPSPLEAMILRSIIGIIVGGGLGFGWYMLVGCPTGTCPLTSNPVVTIIYGAVVGGLAAASFHK